jgi:para-aminobenzoate synthetase/4-amino-4-deoxychorismate lyase
MTQHPDCFALLDDASGAEGARSRLYTGHADTLRCTDAAGWPELVARMQAALAGGLYAVPVLTYELGAQLLGIGTHATAAPLATVLLFSRCEHLTAAEVGDWLATRSKSEPAAAGIAAMRASVDQAAFSAALARIHDYISAGDTYQVNFTYRLRFDAFGDIVHLYQRLRTRQPVPYGALIALPDGRAVLSLSPELFIGHAGGELLARPMKGTAPATDDEAVNATRASALAQDPKNRAENLMIVDLLRNDLGRIAVTGSVDASRLFEVRRFSSVLQMTSTVRAQLRPNASLAEIFTALYPCGSITGAPKRRTMEIIGELESSARGIYTGAIGWFDPPANGASVGEFCLSVPIRTLTLQAEADGVRKGEMGVGAGIVYDSEAGDEYAECQLKARFLTGLKNTFELFETLRASHDAIHHRDRHLARLAASARYFAYPFDAVAAGVALDTACAAMAPSADYRLRLALDADGVFSTQMAPLTALVEPVGLLLADSTVQSQELFLRHKTSIRSRYDAAWRAAEARNSFDALFFNEKGELTEGGRSNVFVRLAGRWITPPLTCGLLPGVMRAVMLAAPEWNAIEGVITRQMLLNADEIVVCNALRGPLRATLLDESEQ